MKKLIIQVPAFNEEQTLAVTLSALPRNIEGIYSVEWLVVDDGSSDRTAQVARECGVHHIVRLPCNQGLARAFSAGIDACLRLGADIIVNTDADNQYDARDIPLLIAPIMAGKAEVVVGARPIDTVEHFSPAKKVLQKLGSWVIRRVSGTDVQDAPSGFRALTREAALRLNVFTSYTYTLETIIQAGLKGMAIASVPVRVNSDLRPSRLVRSIPFYIRKSLGTIIRILVVYRPFRFFFTIGAFLFAAGFFVGLRFVYFYLTGAGGGHVQSLILSAILLGMGFQTMLVAFLADLLAVNRKLLEDIQCRMRRGDRGPGR